MVVAQLLGGGYRGGRARVTAGERAAVAQTSLSLVRQWGCEEGAVLRAPALSDADDVPYAVGSLAPEGTRPRAGLCIVPAWRRRPLRPPGLSDHGTPRLRTSISRGACYPHAPCSDSAQPVPPTAAAEGPAGEPGGRGRPPLLRPGRGFCRYRLQPLGGLPGLPGRWMGSVGHRRALAVRSSPVPRQAGPDSRRGERDPLRAPAPGPRRPLPAFWGEGEPFSALRNLCGGGACCCPGDPPAAPAGGGGGAGRWVMRPQSGG